MNFVSLLQESIRLKKHIGQ